MQSQDIKDILAGSVAGSGAGVGSGSGSGISQRELLSITGGLPPLQPAPTLKPTLDLKAAPAAHWDVIKVQPADARLPFYLWSKLSAQEYQSQLNPYPSFQVLKYTDEEYSQLLVDPLWTRQETDYLFTLCETFELRFLVIADRYCFRNAARPVEELRERYYDVVRQLKTHRGEVFDSAAYNYDKNREIERKRNLEILYSRTPEQAQEEEALYFELRKREQTASRWTRERELLMDQLGIHEIPRKEGDKKKKTKRADPRRRKAEDPDSQEPAAAAATAIRRDRNPYAVHLRSSKMVVARVNMQAKLAAAVEELGVPLRPRMTTEAIVKASDEVKTGVIQVLELKKQVDRVDHEIKVLKNEDPESIGYAARRASSSSNREKRRSTSTLS
ncbi:MAG: hypothetical protein SGCHY_000482, partial [Lobulomycetales sp.]